ncbi:MAG: DUF4249 family protein [Ignavibacteriales bacterium]|nr:DUF4249 family protein [Ignavibacteriales bacterium]
MKNIGSILFIFLLTVSIYSCDDSVNPKTAFHDVYALNCVIRGDTSIQVATITRSYDAEGIRQIPNTIDPFIKGAKIKLTYLRTGEIFFFRDTSVTRPSDSAHNTPGNYYYIKGFKPESNSKISIEAIMPDGKVLKSNSTTYSLSADFLDANSFLFPLPSTVYEGTLVLKWNRLDMRNNMENMYFVPRLTIKYFKIESGVKTVYEKEVPTRYIAGSNEDYPKYPSIAKNITEYYFDALAVEKTLREISNGDPHKENYIIDCMVFRLFALDKDLATYYASNKVFNEEFSVRVVQPNYSNIDGGFGIFGTLSSLQVGIYITPGYIESFGYRYY